MLQETKDKIREKIEEIARNGKTIPYQQLIDFLADECPGEFSPHGGRHGRRLLVDYLDAINMVTCRKDGILLSVVVVGNNGMPDSGFFDKFRNDTVENFSKFHLNRWLGKSRDVQDSEIFQEELAAVYDSYGVPRKIHVLMDLENIPPRETQSALKLLGKKDNLTGIAFTAKPEKNAYKSWSLGKYNIKKEPVPPSGKDAADARLLYSLGGITSQITRRDLVCFFGTDEIYNQAVEIALEEKIKVLRFGGNKLAKWKPQTEGFYEFFDFNESELKWEQKLNKIRLYVMNWRAHEII